MANDVKNTSSKVYRLLSDRCSLRVESAANPLRCCLSWRRACEVRRRGPAGRVRGHRMTGGTPKEVHWTAEQQKRPQRTYRGRKRRETAAQGLDHWACFRPKMSCLSTPPKIRLRRLSNFVSSICILPRKLPIFVSPSFDHSPRVAIIMNFQK